MEQLEISEEDVTLTKTLLGRGGFGTVYVAHYSGKDAAAKIIEVDHDFGASGYPGNVDGTPEGDSLMYPARGMQGWARLGTCLSFELG